MSWHSYYHTKSVDMLEERFSALSRRTATRLVQLLQGQVSSVAARARTRYSDSVLDRDTTCCFLEDQEISESPKYTQTPLTDFQSSGQEPQSASEYAVKPRLVLGFK